MRNHTATARLGESVIARTDHALRIEGNLYFPVEDVQVPLTPSWLTTLCYWKGLARYRHLDVEGRTYRHAAWTYPLPLPWAWFVRGRIAFDPMSGVTVTETTGAAGAGRTI